MVTAVFVSELVDQKPHHLIGDTLFKPLCAQPQFVEHQLTG